MIKFQVVDLFCGGCGVTQGVREARFRNKKVAQVIACINHDDIAILSHNANHKHTHHFTEDIRTFNLSKLPELDRTKIIVLWASLECTNFSKAKGGKPRDADSRTLAEHLYRYIEYINPDYIMIENVREFMAWGKLDENGKPISMDKGKQYLKWVKKVQSYGYDYNFKLLDAADFGARCLRFRYFGLFSKPGLPVVFPEPTHSKKSENKLKKWKAVKGVLDLNDEGNSIFTRSLMGKKELSDNTIKRIYEGAKKFANRESFIIKWNSSHKTKDGLKAHSGNDIHGTCPTVSTQNRLGIVNLKRSFITKYFSGSPQHKNIPIDFPAATVKCVDNQALVTCDYLIKYHGNGKNISDINLPSSAITTKDRIAYIKPVHFIDLQYSNGKKNQPIEAPCGGITTVPKANLVTPKFILNCQYNNPSKDLERPIDTIVSSRRHKYLISPVLFFSEEEGYGIIIYEDDSETMKQLKEFMAENGIIDIKMRMLKVIELKRIMGLPEEYILYGNQSKQKWMIGNMVHPIIPKKWFEALYTSILYYENKAA